MIPWGIRELQAKLVRGTIRRTTEWKSCLVGRPALEGPVRLVTPLLPLQCSLARLWQVPAHSHSAAASPAQYHTCCCLRSALHSLQGLPVPKYSQSVAETAVLEPLPTCPYVQTLRDAAADFMAPVVSS